MDEVKRSEAKKRTNRSISITFFIASIILIICSLVIIVSVIQTNLERKKLMNMYNALIQENEDFTIVNEHLGDDAYYDIYVREEYQFEGNNIIRLPKK